VAAEAAAVEIAVVAQAVAEAAEAAIAGNFSWILASKSGC
jgi:hypothetical protein